MISILKLIDSIISLYLWIMIIHIALSWLIYFGVINSRNGFIMAINDFAQRITEPVLSPIRRWQNKLLTRLNFDLSPIIFILLLQFARNLMWELTVGAT